jgi:hypothetical protein
LTGRVGERYAEFMLFEIDKQLRKPRWVTAQDPPTPPIEKGLGKGSKL